MRAVRRVRREELEGRRVDPRRRFRLRVQRRGPARRVRDDRRVGQRRQEELRRVRLLGRHTGHPADTLGAFCLPRVVRSPPAARGTRGAARLQLVQEGALTAPPHQEQHERVLVEQASHLIAERRRVRTVVPGLAAALRIEIADPRQQIESGRRRVLHQVRRHLAIEERRDVPRAVHGEVEEPFPFLLRELPHQYVAAVRRAVAVLDHRRDAAGPHRHGAHRAARA